MSNMTIEEKARAYDEAVERAKRTLDGLAEDYRCTNITKDDIRYQYSQLFPELHEDEDTMMNRKLIYGLKSLLQQGKETFAGVDIEDLLDYLEKKSTEDKPKEVFHPTLDEIKALDTVFFATDCKRLGVEDTLLNFRKKMSALYRGPKINDEPITTDNQSVNIPLPGTTTTYEQEIEAAEKRYEEEYSTGEYCHEQSFKWGFQEGIDWLRDRLPDIGLIQRSWYMEGYHDREFNNEPKWKVVAGKGGPKCVELTPVHTENNAVNITPRFKVGDIIRFKGDPPSAPAHKVRVVEDDKYYLDNDKLLYLPFTAQDKWDFVATNRFTFTEGEINTIKEVMDYLEYKGMEDYHDSLENLMLKYGGDEK